MMKVWILLLVVCCIIHQVISQNHRSKPPPRGPPRPPPYPPFVKKWQQLQMTNLRGPSPQNRPRPIPVYHNPQKLKKPYPPNNNVNRYMQQAAAQSIRPYWKYPPTTYRSPTEKPVYVKSTEKYAFAFPKQKPKPLKQKEYDFHVQTNQIPSGISSTLNNPIQQVGEKGPIHTIPAPNLSPADKPSNIEHVRPQTHNQQFNFDAEQQFQHLSQADKPLNLEHGRQQNHNQQFNFGSEQQFQHEYHVTEASEPAKHFRINPVSQQNVEFYSQNAQASSYQAQSSGQPNYEKPSEVLFKPQNNGVPSQGNPAEFYQVIQNVQHPTPESEEIPHQQFLQQFPNYQLLISDEQQKQQPQQSYSHQQQQILISETPQQNQQQGEYQQPTMFTSDLSFVQQFQRMQGQEPSERINLNPEFHSFNYNEQDYQKQNSKSSSVSAGYNLDTLPEASEIVHETMARSPGDSQTQSEFIQNYFESKEDNLATNNVEPDAKPSAETPTEIAEEETPEGFFSSLPNKEVADTLASLQAAGKINSNLMQLSSRGSIRQKPMKIFVPENLNDSDKRGDVFEINHDDFQDYEPSENNDEDDNSEILNTSFGDKIKPKRT